MPVSVGIFFFHTGFGVHPASYSMGTASSFPGLKRPGCETDRSPPTSTKIKNTWIYTFIHKRNSQLVKPREIINIWIIISIHDIFCDLYIK
jgi:hypothetical protein